MYEQLFIDTYTQNTLPKLHVYCREWLMRWYIGTICVCPTDRNNNNNTNLTAVAQFDRWEFNSE